MAWGAGVSDQEDLLRDLFERARADDDAAADVWQTLENAEALNHFKVHEYRCHAGCTLAKVVAHRGVVLLRTEPYKLRPQTNLRQSVPRARERNTLDGDHHWPGHVYRVRHLAGRDPGEVVFGDEAHIPLNCKHRLRTVAALTVLELVAAVTPGHPGAPTILH